MICDQGLRLISILDLYWLIQMKDLLEDRFTISIKFIV